MNFKPQPRVGRAGRKPMRVIAGTYKNRLLATPPGWSTRPTMDRIKGAMFNILRENLWQSSCLDLFAGSGALGIEALSRGATYLLANDIDPIAVNVIRQNLATLKIQDTVDVWQMDYLEALKRMGEQLKQFDLVLLDPPYKLEAMNDLIEGIITLNLLQPRASIMIESARSTIIHCPTQFSLKEYFYGDKKLTWLRHQP